MMHDVKEGKEWRDGVFLCTVNNSFEADLLESKLKSEGIPCLRKFQGASNFLEIFMGTNSAYPIDLYVPESALEDAKNIIVAVPISSDDFQEEPVDFDSMTEEEIDELIGVSEESKKEEK